MSVDNLIDHATARHPMLRFIIDRNPFYLLSGVFMLVGCSILFSELHGEPELPTPLLILLGLFELYGIAAMALGIWLARMRRMTRDAGLLLVLTILLMSDVTFLYNELITAHFEMGTWLNLIAAVLAMFKLLMIAFCLRIWLNLTAMVIVTVEMLLLFILPGVFALLKHAAMLDESSIYLAWWGLGAVLVVHTGPWMRSLDEEPNDQPHRTLQNVVRTTMLFVPLLSIIGHVASLNFVYEVPFAMANLGPIVLAGGFAWLHQSEMHFVPRINQGAAFACGGAAILLSTQFDVMITLPVIVDGQFYWITPLRLALFGSALLVGYTWFKQNGWWLFGAMFAEVGMGMAGATTGQIREALVKQWNELLALLRMLIPTTPLAWGALAIASAFIMLALGALISWLGRDNCDDEEVEPVTAGNVLAGSDPGGT